MRFVTPQGTILRDAPYKGYYGVRPAFYLNTDNYTVLSGTGKSANDPYVAVSYTHLDVYKRQAFKLLPLLWV